MRGDRKYAKTSHFLSLIEKNTEVLFNIRFQEYFDGMDYLLKCQTGYMRSTAA